MVIGVLSFAMFLFSMREVAPLILIFSKLLLVLSPINFALFKGTGLALTGLAVPVFRVVVEV